jgi:transposase-like protein
VAERRKRRSFTSDFKQAVLKRMEETDNIAALSKELDIERKLLYCWRYAYKQGGEPGLMRARPRRAMNQVEAALRRAEALQAPARSTEGPPPAAEQRRIAELERKIGEQQVALDFFRAALRHVRDQRRQTGVPGGKASTP